MNMDIVQLINLAVSSGIVLYLLKVEHRFTKLETYMKVLLKQMKLIDKDE